MFGMKKDHSHQNENKHEHTHKANEKETSAPFPTQYSWQISGMDCASCAQKIEKIVNDIPDIQTARVIFSTERLLVNSENPSIEKKIEKKLKSIGYSIKTNNESSAHTHDVFSWHQLRFPLLLALLICFSLLVSLYSPQLSRWLISFTVIIGLIPILKKSWYAILAKNPFAIETLMSIAAIGALLIGEGAEASVVILLFMIGESLEAFSSQQARRGVKALMQLLPKESVIIENGQRRRVSSDELQPDDVIEASAGDRLSADVELLSEFVNLDKSALTGESIPVTQYKGDTLLAGSLVIDNTVQLKVISAQGNNAIDKILHLIEEAQDKKAPIERFIDRFSRYYTPIICLIALLVLIIPPLFFNGQWIDWLYRSLTLLLIGCPCALIISTPAAITSAMANASRHGVLIKGGATLEQLSRITLFAFDKTGTLTAGKPQVTDVIAKQPEQEDQLLQLAAAVEISSSHPLAKAIVTTAQTRNLSIAEATEVNTKAGIGIQGVIDGQLIKILSPEYIKTRIAQTDWLEKIHSLETEGKTVVVVCHEESVLGIIALQDTLRQDAMQTIAELKQANISSTMLTGDNERAAKTIASQLGIDYRASLLPADKANYIEELNRNNNVAMIGDGINDAPALKQASVGIAMGKGSDIALETADMALTHENLRSIPQSVKLAKKTKQIIKWNIIIALGLKGIFLITSILGITGLWIAVLADSGATAIITLNSLRLLRNK